MPAAAPVVNKAVTKTTKKLTQKQQNALSKMPAATTPLAAKGTTKVVKKNLNKTDPPKKRTTKRKNRWGLGGANTGSMHDTNFSKFVNQYAYNK